MCFMTWVLNFLVSYICQQYFQLTGMTEMSKKHERKPQCKRSRARGVTEGIEKAVVRNDV